MMFNIPSWELPHPLPADTFEHDFPCHQVGYVIVPSRVSQPKKKKHNFPVSQAGHEKRIVLPTLDLFYFFKCLTLELNNHHKFKPNVGKYSIHGWYGKQKNLLP